MNNNNNLTLNITFSGDDFENTSSPKEFIKTYYKINTDEIKIRHIGNTPFGDNYNITGSLEDVLDIFLSSNEYDKSNIDHSILIEFIENLVSLN